MVSEKEMEWLRDKLHSPEMQCRQCNITRRVLDELENER